MEALFYEGGVVMEFINPLNGSKQTEKELWSQFKTPAPPLPAQKTFHNWQFLSTFSLIVTFMLNFEKLLINKHQKPKKTPSNIV